MTNFVFMILTILCVHHVSGINKTEILPTMEPYNRTHCKIIFENSFYNFEKEYIAKLTIINKETGNRQSEEIKNNLVKFLTCIPIKEFALAVDVYHPFRTTWLGTSNVFNYDPVNVNSVIKDHGCLKSDGTLGGEMKMKKRNKYFEVCLERMETANSNMENYIIVNTIFFKTYNQEQTETETIEKKPLKQCSQTDDLDVESSNIWIYLIIGAGGSVLIIILLLSMITFAVCWKNKEIRMKEEIVNKNIFYGQAYYADSEMRERNPSYGVKCYSTGINRY